MRRVWRGLLGGFLGGVLGFVIFLGVIMFQLQGLSESEMPGPGAGVVPFLGAQFGAIVGLVVGLLGRPKAIDASD